MSDDESGKITLAVLSQQILTLTTEVTAIREELRRMSNATTDYRIVQSRHDTQISNLGDDLDNLSARVNSWSSLNSFGVIVAGIIAIFFSKR